MSAAQKTVIRKAIGASLQALSLSDRQHQSLSVSAALYQLVAGRKHHKRTQNYKISVNGDKPVLPVRRVCVYLSPRQTADTKLIELDVSGLVRALLSGEWPNDLQQYVDPESCPAQRNSDGDSSNRAEPSDAASGKEHSEEIHLFVPRVMSRSSMRMLRVYDEADLDLICEHHRNSWDIPEPPVERPGNLGKRDELLLQDADADERLLPDLVIVPGVAFDRRGGRVGHGRGYYDRFLLSCARASGRELHLPPLTIGVGLSAQLLEEVPMVGAGEDGHGGDVALDAVAVGTPEPDPAHCYWVTERGRAVCAANYAFLS